MQIQGRMRKKGTTERTNKIKNTKAEAKCKASEAEGEKNRTQILN